MNYAHTKTRPRRGEFWLSMREAVTQAGGRPDYVINYFLDRSLRKAVARMVYVAHSPAMDNSA